MPVTMRPTASSFSHVNGSLSTTNPTSNTSAVDVPPMMNDDEILSPRAYAESVSRWAQGRHPDHDDEERGTRHDGLRSILALLRRRGSAESQVRSEPRASAPRTLALPAPGLGR